MLPVLYQFNFDTPLSQAFAYLLCVLAVAYGAWSGWRNTDGTLDAKSGKVLAPTEAERTQRALTYAVVALVLSGVGLHFALPRSAALGGLLKAKGEGIPIHTYGVLLASGFIAAVGVASRLAGREWRRLELVNGEWVDVEGPRRREQILDLAFYALIGGLGGSRILFILVNWKDYAQDWSKVFDLGGGLVFYGGLIGATFMCWVFARKNNLDFIRLADTCIPTVSLGQCLGRLGCFSAGCCWGDVAGPAVKWGAKFPGATAALNIFGQHSRTSSLAFQSQAADPRYVVEATGKIIHEAAPGAVRISDWVLAHGHTLPVHPTQIYESLGQLCMFLGLIAMRRYRRFHGQIFGMWLMGYAVLRSTVELFRGDTERGTLHGLVDSVPLEAWYNISTSQFISLCMFAFGAMLLWRRGRALSGASGAGGGSQSSGSSGTPGRAVPA